MNFQDYSFMHIPKMHQEPPNRDINAEFDKIFSYLDSFTQPAPPPPPPKLPDLPPIPRHIPKLDISSPNNQKRLYDRTQHKPQEFIIKAEHFPSLPASKIAIPPLSPISSPASSSTGDLSRGSSQNSFSSPPPALASIPTFSSTPGLSALETFIREKQSQPNTFRRRRFYADKPLPIEAAIPRAQMEFGSTRVEHSYAEHNIAREAHARQTGKDLRLYPDQYMALNLAYRSSGGKP